MGIFNKKVTLDEIMKAISDLSDEEKAKVVETLSEKNTDEFDVTESTPKAEEGGTTEENAASAPEGASNETDCGKDCASEEETTAAEEGSETPEDAGESDPDNQTTQDTSAKENGEDVIQILSARVGELEEKIAKLDKLRERMEEYEKKTADRFGYRSEDGRAGKNIYDMTADELDGAIRRGEV